MIKNNLITYFLVLAIPCSLQGYQVTSDFFLQNILNRDSQTLDGLWSIIIDPLENGYYNHRYQPKGEPHEQDSQDSGSRTGSHHRNRWSGFRSF